MDGTTPNSGYGSYMQLQQAAYPTANPLPNMMQPNMGMNVMQPSMNPMGAVQSGYGQPNLAQSAYPQASLAASNYPAASYPTAMGQQSVVPQATLSQTGLINPSQPRMQMQAAAQPAVGATPYQQLNMMTAAAMTSNPAYGNTVLNPPWRAAERAMPSPTGYHQGDTLMQAQSSIPDVQIVDEVDTSTASGDSLQLKGTSVFIAGLPTAGSNKQSTLDDGVVRRFFSSRCGRVRRLRLQPARGYCFIVFESAHAAAVAVGLNGTEVALDSSSPDATTRLVVKYAQDQAGGSEPPGYRRNISLRTSVYTESALRSVKETLKSSEDMDEFYQAVCSVYSWLEGGECSKRTCEQFLHLLQLMSGRASAFKEFDEERARTRELEDLEWHGSMAHQCEGLRRTFEVANKQKVRDILSKPQRKNLDAWTNMVVEAAERFRKLFAAEANMDVDKDAMDTAPPPPPPPPGSVPSPGTKRSADAVALADTEAKLHEQEEALRTAKSRIKVLEQELKAKSHDESSAEHRVKDFEEQMATLNARLKTSNGSATQKINNLEAKVAAMQKKVNPLQEEIKEWKAKQKQWEAKEREWREKEQAWEAKEKERDEKERHEKESEENEKQEKEREAKERQEREKQEKDKEEKKRQEQEEQERLEKEPQEARLEKKTEEKQREVVKQEKEKQEQGKPAEAEDQMIIEEKQNGPEAAARGDENEMNSKKRTEEGTDMEVDKQAGNQQEGGSAEGTPGQRAASQGTRSAAVQGTQGRDAATSPLHACVAACIAVYLSSHPHGTSLSDLAVYLTRLSGSMGNNMMTQAAAMQVVQETFNATPGVFHNSDILAGENLWSLVAFQTLQQLLPGTMDS